MPTKGKKRRWTAAGTDAGVSAEEIFKRAFVLMGSIGVQKEEIGRWSVHMMGLEAALGLSAIRVVDPCRKLAKEYELKLEKGRMRGQPIVKGRNPLPLHKSISRGSLYSPSSAS